METFHGIAFLAPRVKVMNILRHNNYVNPCLHTGFFWCFSYRQLLKTFWQMEIFLIMSNVPLCHNVLIAFQLLYFPLYWFIVGMFSVVCCRFVVCGKGLRLGFCVQHCSLMLLVTDLKNEPYRRADAVRRSQRRRVENLVPLGRSNDFFWYGANLTMILSF